MSIATHNHFQPVLALCASGARFVLEKLQGYLRWTPGFPGVAVTA